MKPIRSRAGLLTAAIGMLYLLIPFQAARTCLGMECLEFLIAATPVAVLSVPWSAPGKWLPPDHAAVSGDIYRGQLLHRSYWPRYGFLSFGFLMNLYLAGAGVEAVLRRRSGRTGPTIEEVSG